MPNVFVVSDTHFSHAKICAYANRPFASVAEMDAALIERWNAVVRPDDKVYHLGDVAMPRRAVHLLGACHGRKILIKGNHDIYRLSDYAPYVADIRAVQLLDGCVLTHVPIHPAQLVRFRVNVHGHLHNARLDDPRYLNVCVEHTDYRPLELSELRCRYPELED